MRESGSYHVPLAFLIESFSCRRRCKFQLQGERRTSARERALLWILDTGAHLHFRALPYSEPRSHRAVSTVVQPHESVHSSRVQRVYRDVLTSFRFNYPGFVLTTVFTVHPPSARPSTETTIHCSPIAISIECKHLPESTKTGTISSTPSSPKLVTHAPRHPDS